MNEENKGETSLIQINEALLDLPREYGLTKTSLRSVINITELGSDCAGQLVNRQVPMLINGFLTGHICDELH